MIRRILLLLLAVSLAASPASAAVQPELTAQHINTDPATGELVFTGDARLNYDGALLLADQIRYQPTTQVAVARGNVILTRDTRRVLADEVVYRIADKAYDVTRMRLGEYPFYVTGEKVGGTADAIVVSNATLTYHEPGPFAPTLKADRLTFVPGKAITAEDARLGIGKAAPVPLGHFEQTLDDPLISYMDARVGYRGSLGMFVDLGLHLPIASGFDAGGDVAYFSKRGVLAGPSGSYRRSSGERNMAGSFTSGYIHDYGDRLTDILNRPIQEDRGFVDWKHHQRLTDRITLLGQLNYWSDSGVVRDFRPGRFYSVQQPDTFFEALYAEDNYIVSLFTRPQPNSYYRVQQRLPELRFDLLPTPIGAGIYERFNASAAELKEDAVLEGPTERSTRFDAYYGLSRPVPVGDWLVFNPVAGGRLTHYERATGGRDDYTRALGEAGADLTLHASGVYAYRNERWGIDGIRHLVTPKLSYRYIPSADKGRAYIPQIDDEVFSTYLQPLGLGDQRNIDELDPANTFRVGVDNTFQTRDARYGSRDLLIFNAAADLRADREPGEEKVSDVHIETSLMPARWFRVDVYNRFAPESFALRELNTRFTIHDGDLWSLSFSNHYLARQIDEYVTEGRYRINEVYQAVARLHYDSRESRFVERSLAIRQNIENLWFVQYGVSFYEGRKRESNFGFSIEVRLADL